MYPDPLSITYRHPCCSDQPLRLSLVCTSPEEEDFGRQLSHRSPHRRRDHVSPKYRRRKAWRHSCLSSQYSRICNNTVIMCFYHITLTRSAGAERPHTCYSFLSKLFSSEWTKPYMYLVQQLHLPLKLCLGSFAMIEQLDQPGHVLLGVVDNAVTW